VLLAKTLRSSTFRAALFLIAIFGAIVIALLWFVYSSTVSYILARSDRAIESDRALLLAEYRSAGRDGLIVMINKFIADKRLEDRVILLVDSSYAIMAGNLGSWPAALVGSAGRASFEATKQGLGTLDRPLLGATFETLPDGSHLLVGKDVSDQVLVTKRIYLSLALFILLMFVLAVVTGIAVTRRTVGRIETINATSRAIMQRGLGERVPLHGSQDEWDQLAENLNSMLDRIEVLMGEVKQATDNVAHDLRTPLTRMRGRLEKAYIGQRDSEADRSLIADTMADLDDVLRMFSSLTRISQIEISTRTMAFRSVDLVEVSQAVVELFDAAAEDKNIDLQVIEHGPVRITGDRDLLFDAVANIVDNAIKHGYENGQVRVELRQDAVCALISVSDDGPGIPAEEHQKIFKRFYRLERNRRTPGNGLGLSLVAAVARLHEANIKLSDLTPGLKVELQLPFAGGSRRKEEYASEASVTDVSKNN
jgi:signal transduction histidine kinase